jgi:hypothetical protein
VMCWPFAREMPDPVFCIICMAGTQDGAEFKRMFLLVFSVCAHSHGCHSLRSLS